MSPSPSQTATPLTVTSAAPVRAPRIVTTSWDDGDRPDLKVAEILRSRGMPGTFYVPIKPYRQGLLDKAELRALSSEGFEIGGHGFSHKLLAGLPAKELAEEVAPCKPILEDILGIPVRMFCYPNGRYDAKAVRALKDAGYCGARTTRMLATRTDFDPFEMPTTLQIYPHRRSAYIRNVLRNVARARKFEGLQVYMTERYRLGNWLELSKRLFDAVLQNGGVWHLYGHSWELESMNLWDGLREILDYVCGREGVTYLPNGEISKFLTTSAAVSRQGI
jgi:peptidoglycan-N-acetylglucosamine deacetylase